MCFGETSNSIFCLPVRTVRRHPSAQICSDAEPSMRRENSEIELNRRPTTQKHSSRSAEQISSTGQSLMHLCVGRDGTLHSQAMCHSTRRETNHDRANCQKPLFFLRQNPSRIFCRLIPCGEKATRLRQSAMTGSGQSARTQIRR